MQGNLQWLGRYSECSDIEANDIRTTFYILHFSVEADQPKSEEITKKIIKFPHSTHGIPLPALGTTALEGVCLPASCDTHDVGMLANNTLEKIQTLLNSSHVSSPNFHFKDAHEVDGRKDVFRQFYSIWRVSALFILFLPVLIATILDVTGYIDINSGLVSEKIIENEEQSLNDEDIEKEGNVDSDCISYLIIDKRYYVKIVTKCY